MYHNQDSVLVASALRYGVSSGSLRCCASRSAGRNEATGGYLRLPSALSPITEACAHE